MFPSGEPDSPRRLSLQRCGRIVPAERAQRGYDIGGFFVAKFTRVSSPAQPDGQLQEASMPKRTSGSDWRHQFKFRGPVEEWQQVADFYGIPAGAVSLQQIVAQYNTPVKQDNDPDQRINRHIYLLSTAAARIFHSSVTRPGATTMIAGGTKLLTQFKGNFGGRLACRWRPDSNGARLFATLATRRLVRVSRDAMIAMLQPEVGEPKAVPLKSLGNPDLDLCSDDDGKVVAGGALVGLSAPVCCKAHADYVWVPVQVTSQQIVLFLDVAARKWLHKTLAELPCQPK